MSRLNKELKEISSKTKDKEYPVENVDYHLVRVGTGQQVPQGWLSYKRLKAYWDKPTVLSYLAKYKNKEMSPQPSLMVWSSCWALYPGVRPDKRWGPVTP
jgi:hypothetical protein